MTGVDVHRSFYYRVPYNGAYGSVPVTRDDVIAEIPTAKKESLDLIDSFVSSPPHDPDTLREDLLFLAGLDADLAYCSQSPTHLKYLRSRLQKVVEVAKRYKYEGPYSSPPVTYRPQRLIQHANELLEFIRQRQETSKPQRFACDFHQVKEDLASLYGYRRNLAQSVKEMGNLCLQVLNSESKKYYYIFERTLYLQTASSIEAVPFAIKKKKFVVNEESFDSLEQLARKIFSKPTKAEFAPVTILPKKEHALTYYEFRNGHYASAQTAFKERYKHQLES